MQSVGVRAVWFKRSANSRSKSIEQMQRKAAGSQGGPLECSGLTELWLQSPKSIEREDNSRRHGTLTALTLRVQM
jgi:hypothetical protein